MGWGGVGWAQGKSRIQTGVVPSPATQRVHRSAPRPRTFTPGFFSFRNRPVPVMVPPVPTPAAQWWGAGGTIGGGGTCVCGGGEGGLWQRVGELGATLPRGTCMSATCMGRYTSWYINANNSYEPCTPESAWVHTLPAGRRPPPTHPPAHTCHEDVHCPVGVAPDLWTGGLIVDLGVSGVLKLQKGGGGGSFSFFLWWWWEGKGEQWECSPTLCAQ